MQTVEERFGNLVRYHLQLQNMTQTELGDRTGLTQRSISAYIHAKQQPSLSVVYSICKELNIDVNEVFGLSNVSEGSLSKNELKIIEHYRSLEISDDEKYEKFESVMDFLKHVE